MKDDMFMFLWLKASLLISTGTPTIS